MESGVCVDCITVEAVSDVLTLQFRQRKTTEERDGKRYGLSLWPQLGQINPPVQRNASRYLAQATSSGKTFWNSGRVVENPRGSIGQKSLKLDFVNKPDKQGINMANPGPIQNPQPPTSVVTAGR